MKQGKLRFFECFPYEITKERLGRELFLQEAV